MELKTKHYKKMLRACGNDQELSESDGEGDEEEKESTSKLLFYGTWSEEVFNGILFIELN